MSNLANWKINIVHFEEKVIPAHDITRCWDCPDFKEYGGPYQDGNSCENTDYPYEDTISGDDIPDHCPKLKK